MVCVGEHRELMRSVGNARVAVKTDKRAVTMEETQDKIQAGIMKGWKAST